MRLSCSGLAFWTLVILIVVAFLAGGSARADSLGTLVVRPLAAACLGVGLFCLDREQIARFRWPLAGLGLVLLLGIIQLIPLPPSIWTALPGREIAAAAGAAGDIEQPWRPIAMVPWRAWNALFALLVPAAAMLLAVACTEFDRRRVMFVVLLMMLVSIGLAALQVSSGYSEGFYLHRITSRDGATGLFANRNHFATVLSCMLPLLVLAATSDGASQQGPLKLWLAGVLAAVALLTLLLTGSRSGLLLAVVAIATALAIFMRSRESAPRGSSPSLRGSRLMLVAVLLLVTMLLVAFAVYFARAEAIERLIATDDSEEMRFRAWVPILGAVRDYFPLGAGLGSFVEVFQIAEPRELLNSSYLNHAHNDWLEWVLETGLLGLILLAGGIGAWFFQLVRLLRAKAGETEGIGLALAGAAIILLLGLASIVDYPVRVPSIALLSAIAAVWMTAARDAPRRARGQGVSRHGNFSPHRD